MGTARSVRVKDLQFAQSLSYFERVGLWYVFGLCDVHRKRRATGIGGPVLIGGGPGTVKVCKPLGAWNS